MTDWIDILKAGEIITGMVGGGLGALVAAFAWWDRRSRAYVDQKDINWTRTSQDVAERLGELEQDMGRVKADLGNVKAQIATLPTQGDHADLRVEMASIGATLQQLNGMTQTLYEAAMRASADDR